MSIKEILDKVTMESGVSYQAKDLDGKTLIYQINAEDRPGAKLKLQKELGSPVNNISFEDGPSSSGSVRSVDFKLGEDKYRVLIKPAGKGSGAGASTTAIGESLQAYACSARQAKGSELTDGTQIWEFVKTGEVDATISLADCKKATDEWIQSAVWVANAVGKAELKSKGWAFERGGKITTVIEEAFKKHKAARGLSLNVNKWNPADIWVYKKVKGITIENAINKCANLAELNDYIQQAYEDDYLKGISLKIITNPMQLKKTLYNKKGDDVIGNIKYHSLENADLEHVKSNDVYIHGKQNNTRFRIQFRRFGGFDHQGEIKGSTANGGKIGGGPYEDIIFHLPMKDRGGFIGLMQKDMIQPFKLQDMFEDNIMRAMGKKSFTAKEADKLNKDIEKNKSVKGKVWWHSKFYGLQLARIMQELDTNARNKVLRDVFTYASSAIPDVSSVFLKVYQ